MKNFKFVLLAVFLSVAFVSNVQAQRGGFLRSLFQNGQDEKNTGGVTSRLDVPYMDDDNPLHKLDIYLPAEKKGPLPVLVHLHGGGWEMGDKKRMKATGMFYASNGVLFITPNYRLSPGVMHPAHAEDCAAVVAWVFNHISELGADKSRVFLSGHSAGAHLAALLSTNPKYLGKYNIRPGDLAGVIPVDTAGFDLLSGDNEKIAKRFVKQAFGSDTQVLTDASPFHNVTAGAGYPDFLILNTTNRASAARSGQAFAYKLNSAGATARFIPVDNYTHKQMAAGMYDPSDPVARAILTFILRRSR